MARAPRVRAFPSLACLALLLGATGSAAAQREHEVLFPANDGLTSDVVRSMPRDRAVALAEAAALGLVPAPNLPAVAITEKTGVLRSPIPGILYSGSVSSEANLSPPTAPGGLSASDARSLFGVDGSGIRIGIISDSFNRLQGPVPGVDTGDLPGATNPFGFLTPVTVLKEDIAINRIDEGRAMAELIHDLAPGAELYFHSAFNNQMAGQPFESSIAVAIDALAAAGCDIIVDDVAYLNQPYFQESLAGDAAQSFVDTGGLYFTAAGNSGPAVWVGSYAEVTAGAGLAHDFDTGAGVDTNLSFAFPTNETIRIVIWWDEPYPSLGTAPSASDFDAFARRGDTNELIATSIGDQGQGDDPFEFIQAFNAGLSTTLELSIEPYLAVNPNAKLAVVAVDGTVLDASAQLGPSMFGHRTASGVQAVAAQGWFSTFLQTFSAVGPADVKYALDGTEINEIRPKPDITATDGTSTTFFGNFFGTSAAAPHAAAVAALGLEYARTLLPVPPSPTQFYQLMANASVEVDGTPPGPDNEEGAGRVDAVNLMGIVEAAVPQQCSEGDVTHTGATLVGQPGFGAPDGIIDLDDLGYFLNFWLPGDIAIADVTTVGATLQGQPSFGVPDGEVTLDDLGYFLNVWLPGCP
ncbi:MAG: GC-type dockerin domain-anchored protein [Planctomycetota bacterium]